MSEENKDESEEKVARGGGHDDETDNLNNCDNPPTSNSDRSMGFRIVRMHKDDPDKTD